MVSEEQNSDVELASEVIPVPQVQPEAVALEVVNDNNQEANNISHRKPRQRKKVLYNAILKQMEFYFSDSNLTKDRFLAELIKQDPDVDLEIFLRFNKIRALTTDISKIAKALRDSQMLKVSDDGTKVSRITPIVRKENIDECTMYIQGLPCDADHEWLITLFSEYGPVAYVSIPKFKSSKKIKGFAFVEFETVEGAEKCLKAFRKKGCELPSQTIPSQILSISTFTEDNKQEENHGINKNDIDSNANEQDKHKSEKSKYKKRKQSSKSDDPQDQSDCSKSKKKKYEDTKKDLNISQLVSNTEENKRNKKKKRKALYEAQSSDSETQSKEKIKKLKTLKFEEIISTKDHDNSESENNSTVNNEEVIENMNEESTTEKKKKKKRKRKHRGTYEALEATDMGLQVMSKKDWKRLRNKYLDLQRSKMKQLKLHLRKAKWNRWATRTDVDFIELIENRKILKYTPNVIVKVEFKEACVDPKGFKEEFRNNNHVKYIDVKEGSNKAFIRCDSSQSAREISEKTTNERQFIVLTGEEDKSYWDKITRDREEKIGKKVRVKQRGRDKLLKKAEKELGKHIKFDEV
ncbi:la-related protein 7 [Phymastichus coffea]|uniref:la-related protein 7 n=1 Tax=Phymastichus coffea TaxID=108790 RepID=UPI00273BD013|nr:la-related protein 7 [Phymastichus coffea]XP_058788957.1 la-related protein 7 [Phymastichus coffea]XP_058788958.1 la-related protein 7 [Phymastichus coffea]